MLGRVLYLALFFGSAVVASILREFGKNVLNDMNFLPIVSDCENIETNEYCVGNQIVYRISFSLACFFLIAIFFRFLTCMKGQEGLCCVTFCQVPFYFGMLFISIFLPNDVFDVYSEIARVGSILFIVLQAVAIVDATYNLRDYILEKILEAERNESTNQALLSSDSEKLSTSFSKTAWQAIYIMLSGAFLIASIIGIVWIISDYLGCSLNTTFFSITIIGSLVLIAISVMSWTNVGLLPATTAVAYIVFLCFQAVHANPQPSCTGKDDTEEIHHTNTTTTILINTVIAGLSITWASWRMSATEMQILPPSSKKRDSDSDNERPYDNYDDDAGRLNEVEKGEIQAWSAQNFQFHFLMVLSCFFMAMMVTNWGSSNGTLMSNDQRVTMWVNVASQWLTMALFLWAFVAPSLFPDRDFGTMY